MKSLANVITIDTKRGLGSTDKAWSTETEHNNVTIYMEDLP